MQFLRTDADLGAKPEFKAVRETGGGIDINGSRVDLIKKTQCVAVIFRDDRFRVAGVVAVDMSDGFIEGSYCPDREYVIEILFAPVFFRSGSDMICSTAKCVERGWITAQLDPVFIQFFLQCCKQRLFDLFVYDNRLTGVADTDALSLCIVDDPDSHVEVCAFINVDMTVSGTGLNDRDRAVFYDSLDQPEAGVSYAGLFFHGNRGLAVHVGDSRIYVIRGGRILQITEDHLEFADLYHKGIITQDQMDIHKKDSKLSAYLGMEDLEEIDEEIFSKYFIFYPGDIFLICTDGLSDTLRNGDLERLVRSLRTEEDMVAGLMKALGQRILDKSDADSTVVLLRIEDTEGETPVRGASTIPRKENYEKREEARTEETAGRARTTAPARPTKTTEEPEPIRRKPVHTPPEEAEEEEYREESLLDQVMKNPRLLAIILCVVVILILLVVLIFKLSKNGGQDSEFSRPNVESQIESKADTESSQAESGSESQTTESGTESAQESQQESKEESQQESKEESKEESREESKEESTSTETTQTYTVAEGDTCYSICMKYYGEGTTEICEALARYNGLDDPTLIWVGQTLKIPPRSELGQ